MLLAAPIGAVFLILAALYLVAAKPPSQGFTIPMIWIRHDAKEPLACDGRPEFVRLTKDHKTWINADQIPETQVRKQVAMLMSDRAERVVYVVVDSELSYGDFARILDDVEGAIPNLHVVVVSGAARRAWGKGGDLCDFHFPPRAFAR